ncbi:hypothetical protein BN2476_710002 [Paraburkholderia piptadeniae]|uniref:Uncharacterized protein n=1 Tax=Paraburkholderia piptadeniae TaxID=1701573 RepID=A0A1N7SS38_9BURK|nr:hypothetical protein [Paraburkholderia piptadeniae]SIT49743.1 hypothetical protein BN2476_710002 [Paraburkholderia piptadeniae]
MTSIRDLPLPVDSDEQPARRILPYVLVHVLERLGERDEFPREYVPYLLVAVERIKNSHS